MQPSALELLGLLTEQETGQQKLLETKLRPVRLAVLSSPRLSPRIADKIVTSGAVGESQLALLRAEDPEIIEHAASTGPMRAPWALRNPNCPEHLLIDAMRNGERAATYAAAVNPSTPEHIRREELDMELAEELIDVGGSTTDRIVRSYEIAIANQWMAEHPTRWGRRMRRGLCGLPGINGATYKQLVQGHRFSWNLETHPSSHLTPVGQREPGRLSREANPAIDLHLLGRDDLSLEHATHMVLRRSGIDPEPHIIARAITRFGPRVLIHTADPLNRPIAGTRIAAAAFVEPSARWYGRADHGTFQAAREAAERLDKNPEAWEYAAAMLRRVPAKQAEYEKIVNSALRLSR